MSDTSSIRDALSGYFTAPDTVINKKVPENAKKISVKTALRLGMDSSTAYSMDRCNEKYARNGSITLGEIKYYHARAALVLVGDGASAQFGKYSFVINSVKENKSGVEEGILAEPADIDGVFCKEETFVVFSKKGHLLKYAENSQQDIILIYKGYHFYEASVRYDNSSFGISEAKLAVSADFGGRCYPANATLTFEKGKVVKCHTPRGGYSGEGCKCK